MISMSKFYYFKKNVLVHLGSSSYNILYFNMSTININTIINKCANKYLRYSKYIQKIDSEL